MLIDLSHFYVMTITLFFLQVRGQASKECDGWFGNCMFLCHCANSAQCNTMGQCLDNEPCLKGYFGPGCQYVDLVWLSAMDTVALFLRDSDDTTCNPDSNATSVEISLNSSLSMSWFRIQVNTPSRLRDFTTILNNGETCVREMKLVVNETVLDVTCDGNSSPLSKIQIEGAAAGSICSIYISGGRNVALKQTTSMPNTTSGQNMSLATNAVDGSVERNGFEDQCAQVDSEWTLTYSRPVTLFAIRVHRIPPSFQDSLPDFTLETFSATHILISRFNHTSPRQVITYETPMTSHSPVTYLTIKLNKGMSVNDRSLVLCEVETYGEVVCPQGMFGLSCKETCQCGDTCSPVTGLCFTECQPGFYGPKCSPCSTACLNSICNSSSGECTQCVAGFTGLVCDRKCDPGNFGQGCASKCPTECSDNCNNVNGECVVVTCAAGTYGTNCAEECPELCLNRLCDSVSGTCTSCPEMRSGRFCQDCPKNRYGLLCQNTCSDHCISCHSVSGECSACEAGYMGNRCEHECPRTRYGPMCQNMCGVHCLVCDNVSGACTACNGGYTGQNCEEACPEKRYGSQCEYRCGLQCTNCDNVHGKCGACEDGYTGVYCELGSSESTSSLNKLSWILLPLLLLHF